MYINEQTLSQNKLSHNFYLYIMDALLKVEGAKGTYIANVAGSEAQGTYNITVISFNKGAKWSPVIAPLLDSNMSPVECYVSLHYYNIIAPLFICSIASYIRNIIVTSYLLCSYITYTAPAECYYVHIYC